MEEIIFAIKKNIRLLLGTTVVIFAVIFLLVLALSKSDSGAKTKVSVNNKTFSVLVAKSDIEKQIGLSSKDKITEDQGMLFLFDKPDYYSFWMKEMKFPIDIIYIVNDKVTTVISNVKPPSSSVNLPIYQPKEKSDMVLEVNAGLAEKYKIQKGTTIKIENL